MVERVLTLRELNRATLARQLLLERRRLPVARAIERVGGLQAQLPIAPYVGLWSRLERFERGRLERALERRQVVKSTLMRMTLHLTSADDYLLLAGAFEEPWTEFFVRRLERAGVDADIEALVRRARAVAKSPRTRGELLEAIGVDSSDTEPARPWLFFGLVAARANLVHTPDSAAWKRTYGRNSLVTARAFLGRDTETGPSAMEHLVRRYLAAFGPATRADLAQWSGLTIGALRPALERLELRTVRDERGRELLDLPRAPLPDPDTPAPVRFLPQWDSVLLAHDDRSRILDPALRKAVIKRNGDVLPTFLVDGFVAGLWKYERDGVQLEPFRRLSRSTRRELDEEAERLGRFLE
jgi:Winged helix DNA-binding domain